MRFTLRSFLILISLFSIFGCKIFDLREEAETLSESLEAATNRLALAVPGEMYHDMIRKCNGLEGKEAQKTCIEFAADLLNIKPAKDDKDYVMTAWFEYPENKVALRADLVPWDDNDWKAAKEICRGDVVNYNAHKIVASTRIAPLTDEITRKRRLKYFNNAMARAARASYSYHKYKDDSKDMMGNIKNDAKSKGERETWKKSYKENMQLGAEWIEKAFYEEFDQHALALKANQSISKPWTRHDRKPFAVILINYDDWVKLVKEDNTTPPTATGVSEENVPDESDKAPSTCIERFGIVCPVDLSYDVDLKVKAVIHKEFVYDNNKKKKVSVDKVGPSEILPGTDIYSFPALEFNPIHCTPHNKPHFWVMYATQYLSDETGEWVPPKRQVKENMDKIDALIKKLKEESK